MGCETVFDHIHANLMPLMFMEDRRYADIAINDLEHLYTIKRPSISQIGIRLYAGRIEIEFIIWP